MTVYFIIAILAFFTGTSCGIITNGILSARYIKKLECQKDILKKEYNNAKKEITKLQKDDSVSN